MAWGERCLFFVLVAKLLCMHWSRASLSYLGGTTRLPTERQTITATNVIFELDVGLPLQNVSQVLDEERELMQSVAASCQCPLSSECIEFQRQPSQQLGQFIQVLHRNLQSRTWSPSFVKLKRKCHERNPNSEDLWDSERWLGRASRRSGTLRSVESLHRWEGFLKMYAKHFQSLLSPVRVSEPIPAQIDDEVEGQVVCCRDWCFFSMLENVFSLFPQVGKTSDKPKPT